jgi:hypothetical protein
METHNQESNQSPSSQGCGCLGLLAVLALTPLAPAVAFLGVLLGLFWLFAVHRWAAVLLGLTLAITCLVCAVVILSDPSMGDMASTGLLFLPWAGFGLWLAAQGLARKRSGADGNQPHDP